MAPHKKNFFWIISIINAVFFAGYLVLKFPLAFILEHHGFSLSDAYSLSTTSTTLFALCSLCLTWTLKEYKDQKHAVLLSVFLVLVSVLCLDTKYSFLEMLGLSLYVVGGSLYFFNMTLWINKQFSTAQDRLNGNYISQILLNVGAFFGSIVFIFSLSSEEKYFHCSIILILISFLSLCAFYFFIKENASKFRQKFHLYKNCFILVIATFFCLKKAFLTQKLVLTLFVAFITTVLIVAVKQKKHGYVTFMLLVLFFSLPYWVSCLVLYNQFFIFLHDQVLSFFMFPATAIILLDPLGNVLFGLGWQKINRDFIAKPYLNLQIGMSLIALAFGLLWFGLYQNQMVVKLNAFYPIVTLLLFSCAQFLIQPTLHSQASNLIEDHKDVVFGLGVLRSIRAVAAIFAFSLMSTTVHNNADNMFDKNGLLYLGVSLIALLSLIVFRMCRHSFMKT